MKLAYFDCSSGIAGNMILGCLFDAGLDFQRWRRALAGLGLPIQVTVKRVRRQGIRACQVEVIPPRETPARNLSAITGMIRRAQLPPQVATCAIRIFERLARAEARVHGTSLKRVHFHELGGYDCIVDIVGAVLGLKMLSIEGVHSSAVNLGRGVVRFSHGVFPVPAPATAELLQGVPVYQPEELTGELATPTGAAILTELAEQFGPMPAMRLLRTGCGAGTRRTAQTDVLRMYLGETAESESLPAGKPVTVVETNIDDMNPELLEHVMARLFAQGALDVHFAPIYMKKNRPATLLTVIAPLEQTRALVRTILTETTSLGVRFHQVERVCLERRSVRVRTRFGAILVKFGWLDGRLVTVSPEYESCRQAAEQFRVPVKIVYAEAMAQALRQSGRVKLGTEASGDDRSLRAGGAGEQVPASGKLPGRARPGRSG